LAWRAVRASLTGAGAEKFRWLARGILPSPNPAEVEGRRRVRAVNGGMGYIIALVILVVVVPLLFVLLSRRTSAGGGGMRHGRMGVTYEKPSADEPTPGAPGAVNQPAPGAEKRIPPA
jgi:hypothetical protein